jgi:O-antigen/teichoic acid export membrane protein
MFVSICQTLLNRTDILMLGVMTDMGTVGAFGSASRIAAVISFPLYAINTVAAPMLSASYQTGKIAEFFMLLRKAMRWSTLTALPIFSVIFFWPEAPLLLFGNEFVEQAQLIVRILVTGEFVNAATGPIGLALLMSGRERHLATIIGGVVLFKLGVNIIAIDYLGGVGAAIVRSFCLILLNAICWYSCLGMKK